MTYRVPFLAVKGPDGDDQLPQWGSRLIGVRVVTRFVDEYDECTFRFTNKPPYVTTPAENTPFTVSFGWSVDTAVQGGTYYFQRVHLIGDPKRGEEIQYICRSGLMADLNTVQSQYFSADNGHTTLGDVFSSIFSLGNVPVEVAPSIASMPLPSGYLLQWRQSNIDFASSLANDVGGVVKPMGGKILVLDRNAGQSVTGQSLASFNIILTSGYGYDVEMEPRFQYQSVSASYFDNIAGKLRDQSSPDSGTGAKDALPHPAPDQASAEIMAKSRAADWRRFTGQGIFFMPGEPLAVAGSRPNCFGFPDPIDDTKWIAAEVTHDIEPGRGWTTTVETDTDAD